MLKDGSFINKRFKRFFVVNMIAWFVTIAGEMIASLMAGLFINADAVTAVELNEPIFCIVFFFGIITSPGAAIMFSKEIGAYNTERAKKIAGMSIIVSIALGIIMSLSLFIFKDAIINFYGCEGRVLEYTSKYYDTFIWHSLIYPFYWAFYYLACFDGDEKTVIISDFAVATVDLIACIILVKPLGITGIGLGNVLAVVAGIMFCIPHYLKKSNTVKFKLHFAFNDLIEMVKISAPIAMAYLFMAIVDIIFNKMLIKLYGSSYIPAYTVVNTIINFTNLLCSSINAGEIFMSINFGENNPYAIKRTMKMVFKYAIVLSLVLMGIMLLIAPYWARIFSIEIPEIIELVTFTGYVLPLSYIAAGIVYTLVNYYPIVDHSFEGNVLSFTYMFSGPLLVALPLCYLWGFKAMIIGFTLIPVLSLLIHIIYLKIKKSSKNYLMLEESDEKELHYDLLLNEENINELCNKMRVDLITNNIEDNKIQEIIDAVNDSLITTLNYNKKHVFSESSILFNDNHLRIIIRDDGIIANLLIDIKETTYEKQYDVTTSFNRNTFIFKA